MKFETPLVKFMVTADGPACFDISKEGNEVIDSLAREGTVSICDCLCECLCTCRMMCECMCECLCTCKCECPCLCPGPPIHDNPHDGDGFSERSPVRSQIVAFGNQFMLRRESFGGFLFNKESFSSYLCNHSAFEILRFIENKRDGFSMAKISELVDHLRNVFDEVPDNSEIVILAFIRGCTKQTFVEGV